MKFKKSIEAPHLLRYTGVSRRKPGELPTRDQWFIEATFTVDEPGSLREVHTEITARQVDLFLGALPSTPRALRCATVGCSRPATAEISYSFPESREVTEKERVCRPCGQGYASRPSLHATLTEWPVRWNKPTGIPLGS